MSTNGHWLVVGDGLDIIGADSLTGRAVYNERDEYLGSLHDFTLDPDGRIAYAVLSFDTLFGGRNKLFAIPWLALSFDDGRRRVVLEGVGPEQLEEAAGFDEQHWPSIADYRWAVGVTSPFGKQPFWDRPR